MSHHALSFEERFKAMENILVCDERTTMEMKNDHFLDCKFQNKPYVVVSPKNKLIWNIDIDLIDYRIDGQRMDISLNNILNPFYAMYLKKSKLPEDYVSAIGGALHYSFNVWKSDAINMAHDMYHWMEGIYEDQTENKLGVVISFHERALRNMPNKGELFASLLQKLDLAEIRLMNNILMRNGAANAEFLDILNKELLTGISRRNATENNSPVRQIIPDEEVRHMQYFFIRAGKQPSEELGELFKEICIERLFTTLNGYLVSIFDSKLSCEEIHDKLKNLPYDYILLERDNGDLSNVFVQQIGNNKKVSNNYSLDMLLDIILKRGGVEFLSPDELECLNQIASQKK